MLFNRSSDTGEDSDISNVSSVPSLAMPTQQLLYGSTIDPDVNSTTHTNGSSLDAAFVSSDYLNNTARTISRVAIPIVIFIGLVGNASVFAIMSRATFRKMTVPVYLASLAVFDTIVLLYTAIGWTHAYIVLQPIHSYVCSVGNYIFLVSVHSSCWILVSMTIHRFLYIYFPRKRKVWYTRQHARVVCVTVVVIFCVLDFCSLFMSESSEQNVNMMSLCAAKPGMENILKILVLASVFLYSILPSIIIFIVNLCIVYWILEQPQLNSLQYTVLAACAKRVTVVLLLISSIFIISSMTLCGVYITAFVPGNNSYFNPVTFAVVEVIWLVNYGCNFYVSVGTSKEYRAEMKKMIRCSGMVGPQVAVSNNVAVG